MARGKNSGGVFQRSGGSWDSGSASPATLGVLGQGIEKLGDPDAFRAYLSNMLTGHTMGGGGMNNIIEQQRLRDALRKGSNDLPQLASGLNPKPNFANPYGGGSAGMTVQGGPSPFQQQLSEELNRMAAMRKEKSRDMDLERRYSNAQMTDKLNLLKSMFGKMFQGQDVMKETEYLRQAGNLVPVTKTTTKTRDYLPQLMQLIGGS